MSMPCAEFHNLDHPTLIPGSKTLFIAMVDPGASFWESLSDSEAQETLVRWINHIQPGTTAVPTPAAFFMTRHSVDPLARGSYSTKEFGFERKDFDAAFAPLIINSSKDKNSVLSGAGLYFSGEATCFRFNGYLHGALAAGRKAAGQVLYNMGKLPVVPTSICDVIPE